MSIVMLLIPLALLLVSLALAAFLWSVRSGQLDDVETPAYRILHDSSQRERKQREGQPKAPKAP